MFFLLVSWSGFPIAVDTFAFFRVVGTPDPGAQGGREAPRCGPSVAEVTVLLGGKQSSRGGARPRAFPGLCGRKGQTPPWALRLLRQRVAGQSQADTFSSRSPQTQ